MTKQQILLLQNMLANEQYLNIIDMYAKSNNLKIEIAYNYYWWFRAFERGIENVVLSKTNGNLESLLKKTAAFIVTKARLAYYQAHDYAIKLMITDSKHRHFGKPAEFVSYSINGKIIFRCDGEEHYLGTSQASLIFEKKH